MASPMNNGGGSENGDMNDQQKNEPIVHVRADSDSTLEDLFAIVHKPQGSTRQLTVPLRLRNLPPSFFKPPSSGSKSPAHHSREPSGDSSMMDPFSPGSQSVGSPQQPTQMQQQQPPPPPPEPTPMHSRAHSSPATLQQTLAVAQQQTQHLHLRQPSYDVSTPADNIGPLPPGWEMAKTREGQVYYMNHTTKTTCWEDPRKHAMQQQMQMQMQQLHQQQQQQNGGSGSESPQPPMSPQPPPPPGAVVNAQQRSNSFDSLGALPQGWEQGVTPDGEVYFINHANQKTTWFDPRIPIQNQRVPIRRDATLPPGMGAMTAAQNRQQEARLLRLEAERRTLQLKQAELKKQLDRRPRSQSQENMQLLQAQEMLRVQTITDPDPMFSETSLHQQPMVAGAVAVAAAASVHHKQESADSGVGGMGSNFNLGSIPEVVDMDSAMDTGDLDTTLTQNNADAAGGPTTQQQCGGVALNGPAVSVANNVSNGNTMDSTDQLIPSLPAELGEVLSHDIMQDVLNNRGDAALTWL